MPVLDVEDTLTHKTHFVCPEYVMQKELIRSVLVLQSFAKLHL
jgi:hypothetical protein